MNLDEKERNPLAASALAAESDAAEEQEAERFDQELRAPVASRGIVDRTIDVVSQAIGQGLSAFDLSTTFASKGHSERSSAHEAHAALEAVENGEHLSSPSSSHVCASITIGEELLGTSIRGTWAVPKYVLDLPGVTVHAKGAPAPNVRHILAAPPLARVLARAAERFDVVDAPKDARVIEKCDRAATAALEHCARTVDLFGREAALGTFARADEDPIALLLGDLLHLLRDFYGVELERAIPMVASAYRVGAASLRRVFDHVRTTSLRTGRVHVGSNGHIEGVSGPVHENARLRGVTLARIQESAALVATERARWDGDGVRAAIAEVEREVQASTHQETITKARELDAARHTAPASVFKTPRELGAIVLRHAIGERESASFKRLDPTSAIRTTSVRDGFEFQVAAMPVVHALGLSVDGLVVEEQTGPATWRSWSTVPADETVGLSDWDVDRIARVFAPPTVMDAVRRHLRARGGAQVGANIHESALLDARGGMIALAFRKRKLRKVLSASVRVWEIEGSELLDHAGMLIQAAVRGFLLDPLIVASELARAAKAAPRLSRVARAWSGDLLARREDGLRWLEGGPSCIGAGCFVDEAQ